MERETINETCVGLLERRDNAITNLLSQLDQANTTIDKLLGHLEEAANDIHKSFRDDAVIEFTSNKYRAIVKEVRGE